MKENIFADLYNKVLSFFVNAQAEDQTKSFAVNRLKTVLMQDRAGFSERAMQMLKDDMLTCISKYVDIDEEIFDLQLEPGEGTTTLRLSIPVIRTKTDEEIDKILEEEVQKSHVKTKEIVEELEDIIEERAQELAGVIAQEENNKEISKEEDKETLEDKVIEEKVSEEATLGNDTKKEEVKEESKAQKQTSKG